MTTRSSPTTEALKASTSNNTAIPSAQHPQAQANTTNTTSTTGSSSSSSKRKGTRSVSTLTPSQLARKRANDREAQRAIRARTKEHIDRLERELEELKSRHSRDETVQDLLKRNKALERELMALRETLGIQGRPFPNPAYDDPSPVATRPSSYGHSHSHGDYGTPTSNTPTAAAAAAASQGHSHSAHSGFGASYLPTPEPCESWSSVGVPVSAVSVPSVVSSPSSSAGNADEYVPSYIPTSVPSSMMEGGQVLPPQSMACLDSAGGVKMEYDDVESDRAYHHHSHSHGHHHHSAHPHSSGYMQQQSWSVYPATYYPQSPAL